VEAAPEPGPPPEHQIIGGIFNPSPTSELIPDTAFHTSVQSPVTQTWRRSIEEAEKRARERGSKWIG
jgi:hypothetical protein